MLVASRLPQRPSNSREARDGRHDRIGTIRQHDVLGGVAHTVDLDHARPSEAGPCRAAGRCPPPPASAPGRRRVIRDHEVRHLHGLGVDLGVRRGVARGMHRLAGAQQGLGRDARPVELAPDQLALDDRGAQSTLGQRTGGSAPGEPAPGTMTS